MTFLNTGDKEKMLRFSRKSPGHITKKWNSE